MGGASANNLTDQSGGLNGDTLGDTGGSETQALAEANLPAHTHTFSDTSNLNSQVAVRVSGDVNRGGSGQLFEENTVTVTISGTTSSVGSGTAHNNVQPTIILNYIIKT